MTNGPYILLKEFGLTGDERIELPPKVLETPIIPFDQSPTLLLIAEGKYLQNFIQSLYR